MSHINLKFITQEDRKHFRETMIHVMAESLLSISHMDELADDDDEILKMSAIREDMIHGFNLVNLIINMYKEEDTVTQKDIDKAREGFNLFLESHNKLIEFRKKGMSRWKNKS